jgi:hypothetical protein
MRIVLEWLATLVCTLAILALGVLAWMSGLEDMEGE